MVRPNAPQLSVALEQLGTEFKEDFGHTEDNSEEVFAAYAADHGQYLRACPCHAGVALRGRTATGPLPQDHADRTDRPGLLSATRGAR